MNLFLNKHCNIVKIINVVGPTDAGNYTIGYILYKRKPIDSDFEIVKTNNYIFEGFSDGMKLRSNVEEIDNLILDAVKTEFPGSYCSTFSVIGEYGKVRFENIINREKETAVINVMPSFQDADLNMIAGKSYARISADVNIYRNYTLKSITGHYFNTECNFEQYPEILAKFDQITFL